jgi:hypothetical protein
VPLPGTTNVPRLEENLAADDVTLNEAELGQLDDLSSRVELPRFPRSPDQPLTWPANGKIGAISCARIGVPHVTRKDR